MRTLLSVAIIALLFETVGSAQSLAETARAARAQRQALQAEGAVYTNENVRLLYGLSQPPPSPAAEPDVESVPVDGSEPTSEPTEAGPELEVPSGLSEPEAPTAAEVEAARLEWEQAVAQQERRVQNLEDQEVSQSLEVGRLRGLITAPTGTQQARNQAQTALTVALAGLDGIRTEIEEARAELERTRAESPGQP